MEHTKKFVLMDPRFVRPSMRDKVLSGLDSDISNILNSDESDEIKAKNYAATLGRFRIYSDPPKPEKPKALPAAPPTPFKPTPSRKRVIRAKQSKPKASAISSIDWDHLTQPDSTHEAPLWKRSRRIVTRDKFGPQWTDIPPEKPKKKKKSAKRLKTWFQY